MTFDAFMAKVFAAVIQPLLVLLFGIAFIIFVWGIVSYIRSSDSDKDRAEGQRSILWGIVGMVIMISAFGIINIIQGTIGVEPTPAQQTTQGQFQPILNQVPQE